MTDSTLFFEEMDAFHLFQDLVVDDHYADAPSDWWVIITDVKGSTVAIENGRYKDVNTIGAATLAAIQNATGQLQFPFVFGGDGATALIPGQFKDAVERELSALRSISTQQFDLSLRVGMVSVDELNRLGFPVTVGKYMLSGNYPLAIFRGGALTKAEELIKASEAEYEVPQHPNSETNLRQLSCRWKPLESTNGTVISLLLMDPQGRIPVYAEFLQELEAVLAGDVEKFNPVNREAMTYRPVTEMLSHDAKYQLSLFGRLPRMVDTLIATILFKWGAFKLIPVLRNYVEQTPTHSDFRKFDDMIRMILDCSREQAHSIQMVCEKMRQEYGICFGVHESESALMTCYVPSFADGSHIHFVDGSDGGYALAAKQLKAQLKEYAT